MIFKKLHLLCLLKVGCLVFEGWTTLCYFSLVTIFYFSVIQEKKCCYSRRRNRRNKKCFFPQNSRMRNEWNIYESYKVIRTQINNVGILIQESHFNISCLLGGVISFFMTGVCFHRPFATLLYPVTWIEFIFSMQLLNWSHIGLFWKKKTLNRGILTQWLWITMN